MPFLRGTTPIWGTQDLPGRFKEWKACFVEIGQTAHKLETNARANFPMAENLAYQFMENNVIAAGMSKRATQTRFSGNYKI